MEILLVVAWAITLLCGTGGLLAVFHRLDILKGELERVKFDVIRMRTTQLETVGKMVEELPPVPVRDETALALGGRQIVSVSRLHSETRRKS